MIKNYLKTAYRFFLRNKIFSIINIIGLSIGMVCFFFILIYVINETSYDKFNEKGDQIYRVLSLDHNYNDWITPQTPYQLAPNLKNNFPEIIKATRTIRLPGMEIKKGNDFIQERNFQCSDNDIFDIFSFSVIKGDSKSLLAKPNSVVISEKMAKKYFEKEDPIGKVLTINNDGLVLDLIVTGIIKDIPKYSTFKADFIGSIDLGINELKRMLNDPLVEEKWEYEFFTTFILLPPNFDINILKEKLNTFPETFLSEKNQKEYDLQNLNDIYLKSSQLLNNFVPSGNITTLYIFFSSALFILLIASLNYIILSTALSAARFKEIGIRKVFGANKTSLIKQIQIETILISCISFVLALTLVNIFLPVINELFGYEIIIEKSRIWQYVLGFIFVTVLVSLISGAYVSFYLSSQKVVDIFKSKLTTVSKSNFKGILIIVQLFIFITLTILTILINKQLQYSQNRNLGFNKDNLLLIYFYYDEFNSYEAFKNEIKTFPGIISISGAAYVPPSDGLQVNLFPGFKDQSKQIEVEYIAVDFDFIETLEFELINGRSFSKKYPVDFSNSVIFNEKAVKELEISDPIGQVVDGKQIIGILKNFHIHSFYEKVMPLFFYIDIEEIEEIVVRIQPENKQQTLAFVENKWKELSPEVPFRYNYFDEALNDLYMQDKQLGKILTIFSALSIFIAMLGLFGLSLFIIRRKIKEISIRKIHGASVSNIIFLQLKKFIYLVLIASVFAWPVAYFLISEWLQNFVYHISVLNNTYIFIGTSLLAMFVVVTTVVGVIIIKVNYTNPVSTLRYE